MRESGMKVTYFLLYVLYSFFSSANIINGLWHKEMSTNRATVKCNCSDYFFIKINNLYFYSFKSTSSSSTSVASPVFFSLLDICSFHAFSTSQESYFIASKFLRFPKKKEQLKGKMLPVTIIVGELKGNVSAS